MYFAGIFISEMKQKTSAVIIEKILRCARKEYSVQAIRELPYRHGLKNLVSEIRTIYEDTGFLRKKKVFSQDRRPSKNTFTPPLLVVGSVDNDPAVVQALRDEGIPVDGFFFQTDKGWRREDLKILRYGCNLHAGRADMEKLARVLDTPGNLKIDEMCEDSVKLEKELERFSGMRASCSGWPDVFLGEEFLWLPALFLALWHCESVKQVKRY